MCNQLNIQYSLITAFYLQSNGMLERVHGQIKDRLQVPEAGSSRLQHPL
jgi:hypothetical protein